MGDQRPRVEMAETRKKPEIVGEMIAERCLGGGDEESFKVGTKSCDYSMIED